VSQAHIYKGMGRTTASVARAINALRHDRTVKVKSVKEAGTLVTKLGQVLSKRAATGKGAERINLCKVSVPGTNLFCGKALDIPRDKMPQLSGVPTKGSKADKLPKDSKGGVDLTKAFVDHLMKEKGVKVTEQTVKASDLKASQAELKGEKVAGMMNNKDFDPAGEMIFVSKDGYVIDGHHRWAAQIGRDVQDGRLGDLPMRVRVLDVNIREALDLANEFSDDMGMPKVSI